MLKEVKYINMNRVQQREKERVRTEKKMRREREWGGSFGISQ